MADNNCSIHSQVNDAEFIRDFYNNFPSEMLLKPAQAKKVLPGKSDSWWERKRWEGTGPKFLKIGGHVYYTKQSLLDFIRQHQASSSTSELSVAA